MWQQGSDVPSPPSRQAPPRIRIENPWPIIDCGRFPAKRTAGDVVEVSADVWRDGHDILRAEVRFRGPDQRTWSRSEMRRVDAHVDGDRWAGTFPVTAAGRWQYTIEAWTDTFATWRDELARKVQGGQEDLASEVLEGALLLERAIERVKDAGDRRIVEHVLEQLRDDAVPPPQKHAAALDSHLAAALARHPDRTGSATLTKPLELIVDR